MLLNNQDGDTLALHPPHWHPRRILGAWAINRHSMPQSTQELRSRIDAATPDAVEVFARGETNLSDESAAAVPAATSGPDVSLVYDLTGTICMVLRMPLYFLYGDAAHAWHAVYVRVCMHVVHALHVEQPSA